MSTLNTQEFINLLNIILIDVDQIDEIIILFNQLSSHYFVENSKLNVFFKGMSIKERKLKEIFKQITKINIVDYVIQKNKLVLKITDTSPPLEDF